MFCHAFFPFFYVFIRTTFDPGTTCVYHMVKLYSGISLDLFFFFFFLFLFLFFFLSPLVFRTRRISSLFFSFFIIRNSCVRMHIRGWRNARIGRKKGARGRERRKEGLNARLINDKRFRSFDFVYVWDYTARTYALVFRLYGLVWIRRTVGRIQYNRLSLFFRSSIRADAYRTILRI